MALGNKLVNSINSPRITRSLIRGGTGGSDDWMAVGCTCACPKIDYVDRLHVHWHAVAYALIMVGRSGASTCSEAVESSSSASGVSLSALHG